MTYPPGRLDRAAGSAARRLLRWAGGRRGSAPGTWIRALSAEADQIDTGLGQLAWAIGVLHLVLAERGTALAHRWRPRLLWLATAGGLGGLRVYGPAAAAGIGMFVWSYANSDLDVPLPAAAAVLFAPFYVLRGFLVARRRSVEVAAAVGAVTAVVGLAVVTLGAVAYVAVTESWSVPWLFLGLTAVLIVAPLGAVCGAVGGALAHPTTNGRLLLRSLRTAALRSLRGQ